MSWTFWLLLAWPFVAFPLGILVGRVLAWCRTEIERAEVSRL